MVSTKNVCYAKVQREKSFLDIYLPTGKVEKVYIYFHGGGLVSGDKWLENLDKYVSKNIAVVCPDYRLYPNAKFPDFLEDSAEAVAFVKSNLSLVGGCDQIFIGGSSAGGYISMMLYFDAQYLAKHGLSVNDFAGFVHDAGQPTTHFNVLNERGMDTRRVIVDDAAPLFHIKEYVQCPPMMFFVAERDMQNRFEQTQLMLSTLKFFHYPSDKIIYRFMENYGHCAYLKDDVYVDAVCSFILGTNKD